MPSIPLSKICTKCGKRQSLDRFHRRSGSSDGRTSHCKPCKAAWKAEYAARPKIKVVEKTCTKCGGSLPASGFHNDKTRKDGLFPWCKQCAGEYAKNWYEDNHDYALEIRRQHYQATRESQLVYKRRYYRANKETHLEWGRRWQQANRDKVAKANRKWRKKNPEKQLIYRRNRIARLYNAEGEHTAEQFQALVNYYGDRCLCCGKCEPLTADHVIALANGGTNDIGNIQPLCGPCNYSKAAWHDTDYRPDGGAFARQLTNNKDG